MCNASRSLLPTINSVTCMRKQLAAKPELVRLKQSENGQKNIHIDSMFALSKRLYIKSDTQNPYRLTSNLTYAIMDTMSMKDFFIALLAIFLLITLSPMLLAVGQLLAWWVLK